MSKPIFHVGEEFLGVTTVQFNQEFNDILLTFLGEIVIEDMEPEIIAFRRALNSARSRTFANVRTNDDRMTRRHQHSNG